MATGWLSWAVLLLAAGAPGAEEVVHVNMRGFQIPIIIQPERKKELRELLLYLSKDQGKTWETYNSALPTAKGANHSTVCCINARFLNRLPSVRRVPQYREWG